MKMRERVLLFVCLALMGATALGVAELKSHRRLGKPGVRAEVVPGSPRMFLDIVTNVAGYDFREVPMSEVVTNALPPDTSFRQCTYSNAEGFVQSFVVMMGGDRTSIHQPQFCLTGAGWSVDGARSEMTTVRIERPRPVDLPVMKLIPSRMVEQDGKKQQLSGVYVYWYVADNVVTANHSQFGLGVIKHMLKTGELQRWAYVTYFSPCYPGQEDRAFNRIQRLMNKTLPEFQLSWPPPLVAGAAR